MIRTLLMPLVLGLLPACSLPASAPASAPQVSAWSYVPDLPISAPPYQGLQASWKQRLDVPYVYMEHRGTYSGTGALIPLLHRELLSQGLEPDGPPFGLFYDDPARVATGELRSRACIPVRGSRAVLAPLGYDVLASRTVGYAFVSGPYPDVPRAYPGLHAYLRGMGWAQDGPIREVYLVAPGANPDPGALICEIQVPASPGGSN